MSARQCRDTFLHFLADHPNLVGIPVHNLRQDPSNPDLELLQRNAINVEFLNTGFGSAGHDSKQQVEIDILNDDELTAVDWAQSLANALQTAGYTPLMDYTTPITPVAVSPASMIRWNPDLVNFRRITADGHYFRFNCTMTMLHR